ncbi:bifunctional phosphopantothenoylcysteine decarboxylase/phosphopantothenate--cysteine ligase CoaBC [Ahrensia sp. R2A130]|uniref:bifunctional phosphopantothenoylcysteine decarboxylase/phosphopantothenate--cysteine ligase CoaBC n=1 Tax=Ahrensia sp. R2A130 TaxID=744979 RepID=UPI0001E0E083|nr:bifunctional phosphopantothenoylcysteine decarboxylase/phosphopantothenate--cysteine ligase CoaBC [Ahrensia sp. R2A130]EFL89825.1 phosphopantothenoylcysteine decarboxylase/phosphopantothenate--cysteine ligase [Ahrensia sp. R2A130]
MVIRQSLEGRSILLIISGGIAAYKSLDLIRRLRERGARVRCVMSEAAQNFVTPMAVGALTGETVFTQLWDRDAEQDIGHIRLAREADLVIVAPATADLMAKMANGLANDLASTVLLAVSSPVLVAPAMNPAMWDHPATQRNADQLMADGILFTGPADGEMAESGEAGTGRMSEVMDIVTEAERVLDDRPKPLAGKRAVITSGPTREAIDPVRYISNHSSGKQGHAIAAALADAGADVILVSGPVTIDPPADVTVVDVVSAQDMADAVDRALPADIAVFVAAVADWRVSSQAPEKMKKDGSGQFPALDMVENPDILRGVAQRKENRPALVIGFAAETEKLEEHAKVKLAKKGADWIVANDVSEGVFGTDRNSVTLVTKGGAEKWPASSKDQVAMRLVERIAERFETVAV